MDKARIGGALICLGVIAVAALFIWGLAVINWTGLGWGMLSIAVPVGIGVLGVLALGFWIGWTMASTKVELPPPQDTGQTSNTTS